MVITIFESQGVKLILDIASYNKGAYVDYPAREIHSINGRRENKKEKKERAEKLKKEHEKRLKELQEKKENEKANP